MKTLEDVSAEAMTAYLESLMQAAKSEPERSPLILEMANDVLRHTGATLTTRGRAALFTIGVTARRNVN